MIRKHVKTVFYWNDIQDKKYVNQAIKGQVKQMNAKENQLEKEETKRNKNI